MPFEMQIEFMLVLRVTDAKAAVSDLRSRWHLLCDLDRARAVEIIHENGMSLSELAPKLNCSASLLSYLLRASRAPVEDRELARSGAISTRELVRRSRTSGTRLKTRQHEAIEFEHQRAVVQASKAIVAWLSDEDVQSDSRIKVIEQAAMLLTTITESDLGDLNALLPDLPLKEVMQLFRPHERATSESSRTARYAKWLALWTHHGIPDNRMCSAALEAAANELRLRAPQCHSRQKCTAHDMEPREEV
jgi:transposase-like protein